VAIAAVVVGTVMADESVLAVGPVAAAVMAMTVNSKALSGVTAAVAAVVVEAPVVVVAVEGAPVWQ
jgi:hypothetical protein